MKVVLTGNLRDLADDTERVAVRCRYDMVTCVRKNAREGNAVAKAYARVSSGRHGKRYPNAFSVSPAGPMSYEYGPVASAPQGGMDFEEGSGRQTRPHRDVARSFERQAPKFRRDVAALPDDWYWPA